ASSMRRISSARRAVSGEERLGVPLDLMRSSSHGHATAPCPRDGRVADSTAAHPSPHTGPIPAADEVKAEEKTPAPPRPPGSERRTATRSPPTGTVLNPMSAAPDTTAQPPSTMRALDAVDEYLTVRTAAKPSPHTLAAYRRDLTAVL